MPKCSHLLPRKSSTRCPQDAPKTAQYAPKTHARRPKTVPRRLQDAPRRPEDAPRRPQTSIFVPRDLDVQRFLSTFLMAFSPHSPPKDHHDSKNARWRERGFAALKIYPIGYPIGYIWPNTWLDTPPDIWPDIQKEIWPDIQFKMWPDI